MGTDNLFNKRRIERKNRSENIRKLKSSNWLIICEGTKTETNYFSEAIKSINKNIDNDYKLKAKIIGKGRNTLSLVNSVDSILNDIDKHRNSTIPYGKIFVVFDKDDFASDIFDKSINVCENKGYIPLWSNQAFEFWILLHFNYIEGNIRRTNYEQKINALTEALESHQIKCFSKTSIENMYRDILNIFLDEEVRMYRGF